MKISIEYLTVGDKSKKSIQLSPEEFFDALDAGENYWEDGVEKYIFPHEHLSIPVPTLKWIEVTKRQGNLVRTYRCQYLDGDKSMTQHTVSENGDEEIITSSLIAENTYHTTRLIKSSDGVWSTYVDSIDSDVEVGGKYDSKNLIKSWLFDELKEFSNVQ